MSALADKVLGAIDATLTERCERLAETGVPVLGEEIGADAHALVRGNALEAIDRGAGLRACESPNPAQMTR